MGRAHGSTYKSGGKTYKVQTKAGVAADRARASGGGGGGTPIASAGGKTPYGFVSINAKGEYSGDPKAINWMKNNTGSGSSSGSSKVVLTDSRGVPLSAQQQSRARSLTEAAQVKEFGKVVVPQKSAGSNLSGSAGKDETYKPGTTKTPQQIFQPTTAYGGMATIPQPTSSAAKQTQTGTSPNLFSQTLKAGFVPSVGAEPTTSRGTKVTSMGATGLPVGASAISEFNAGIEKVEPPKSFWTKANEKVASFTTQKLLPKTYAEKTVDFAEYEKNPTGSQGWLRTWEKEHPLVIPAPKWLGGDIDIFSSKKYTKDTKPSEFSSGYAGGMREGFYTKARDRPLDLAAVAAVSGVVGAAAPFATATKSGAAIFKTMGVIGAGTYGTVKTVQIVRAETPEAKGKIIGESVLELGAAYAGAGTGARLGAKGKAWWDVRQKTIAVKDIGKVVTGKETVYKNDNIKISDYSSRQISKVKVGSKTYDVKSYTKGKEYIFDDKSLAASKTYYQLNNKKLGITTRSISATKPTEEGFVGMKLSRTGSKVSLTPYKGRMLDEYRVFNKDFSYTTPKKTSVLTYVSKTGKSPKVTLGVQQTAQVSYIKKGGIESEVWAGRTESLSSNKFNKLFDIKPTPTKTSKSILSMGKKGQSSVSILDRLTKNTAKFKPSTYPDNLGVTGKDLLGFMRTFQYQSALVPATLSSIGVSTGIGLGAKSIFDIKQIRKIEPSLIVKQQPIQRSYQPSKQTQYIMNPMKQTQLIAPITDILNPPRETTKQIIPGVPGLQPPEIELPIMPPLIPFAKLPPIAGGGNSKLNKLFKIKRKLKYQPSLYGSTYGIKRVKKKYLTGLEVRGY